MGESTKAVLYDEAVHRSENVVSLFDEEVFNATQTEKHSSPLQVGAFRKFTLYLGLASSGTPTTIRFEVLFYEPNNQKWHTYKQGLFAALYFEDTDLATQQLECYQGECAGRSFMLRATAVGTDADNTFTMSASVEFHD